jgi:hypothetical protein
MPVSSLNGFIHNMNDVKILGDRRFRIQKRGGNEAWEELHVPLTYYAISGLLFSRIIDVFGN